MTTTFDESTIAAILALSEDDLADRFVETRRRMRDSLPTRCVDDVLDWSRGRATTYGVVLGEAAVFSLGQVARPMCNRLDALGAEHKTLACLADDYDRLAASADTKNLVGRRLASSWQAQRDLLRTAAELTFVRALGLRSVLCVQLQRESWERDGLSIPPEWRLPVGGGDDGATAELELVPLDPDPTSTGGGGGGGGEEGGGEGGAAPAAVVALPPADLVEPGTAVDDDDDDVLGFLDRDR